MLGLATNALSELRSPPPLPSATIAQFDRDGFCVVPNWLSAAAADAVLQDALLCEAEGLPRRAGIGSTLRGSTAIRQEDQTRRSSQLALIPPPAPSAGDVDTRMALAEALRCLRAELEASVATLPALSPFHTELAYLYYPTGGFYLRHIDVPSVRGGWNPVGRTAEDGGSFSGAALRREVSILLYLNRGWDPAWGGALRVFMRDDEAADERHVDIVPEAGTCAAHRVLRSSCSLAEH